MDPNAVPDNLLAWIIVGAILVWISIKLADRK